MRNIMVLIQNNLKINILKKPFSFILYTIVPVIVILLFSNMFSYSQGNIKVGVIDYDNSKTSNLLIENIKGNDEIQLINIKERELAEKFAQKDIDFSLMIQEDFEKKLIQNNEPNISIKTQENSNLYKVVESNLEIELQNLKELSSYSNKDELRYNELLDKYINNEVKVNENSLSDLYEDYENSRIFISFLIMFMFFKATSGAYIINLDKYSNVYTKIFVAPIKTYEYYIANIISNIITLSLQIFISVLGLKYITKINIGMEYSHLLIILFIIAIVAVSLGNLFISITKTSSEAAMISNLVIMLFLMCGGAFVSLEMLPPVIRKISYFIPVRWAMMSIYDLQQGLPFEHV
ncbi:MAG: ABC transporter permease, partial [Paraclostridium sp.]